MKILLLIHQATFDPLSLLPQLQFISKTCKFCLFSISPCDRVRFSAPTVVKPSFAVVSFDNANGPAACPAHLLHESEDGSVSPVELVAGAFNLLEGAAVKCVKLSLLCSSLLILLFYPCVGRSPALCNSTNFGRLLMSQQLLVLKSMLKSSRTTSCGAVKIDQLFLRC